MSIEPDVVKILLSAIVGALATWLTEPRRQKAAVELELVKHRLQSDEKRGEFEREISKLKSEHDAALRRKEREVLQGLAVEYAKDLRDRRVDVYAALWSKLELLNLYHPKTEVAYTDLERLSGELREWYFNVGGLLLSKSARDAYFGVQDNLTDIIRAAEQGGAMSRILRTKATRFTLAEARALEAKLTAWVPGEDPLLDYMRIRRASSELRTRLCEDIGTRAPALIANEGTTSNDQNS